jgi:hypothetical protein
MTVASDRRRALLTAALGSLQLPPQTSALRALYAWLDNWRGSGSSSRGWGGKVPREPARDRAWGSELSSRSDGQRPAGRAQGRDQRPGFAVWISSSIALLRGVAHPPHQHADADQARPQEEQARRLRHLNSVRELDDGKGIVPVISAVRLSRVDQATVESWSRLHKCFFILRYTTFGHGQTAYTMVDHLSCCSRGQAGGPFRSRDPRAAATMATALQGR